MISIKNLSKNFSETDIYMDTTYKFEENALTCLLGPSGSGKSTLLNIIAGFDREYTGTIEIGNIDFKTLTMDELCKYRFNNIGFIFQQYNLLKGYTALENVLMAIHLNNSLSQEKAILKGKDLLIELGMEAQIGQKIDTLSGGEKQRVAIARALINNPKIILADEPTGALDSEATYIIMEILKYISKTKTVIVITHDEEVSNYADEIIYLDEYNIKDYDINKEVALELKDNNKEIEEGALALKESTKMVIQTPKLGMVTAIKLSLKNFKIHLFKFIIAALIIACGAAAFVASLGSKSIIDNAINDFKGDNFFYNKGLIPKYDKGEIANKNLPLIFKELNSNENIEDVHYKYDLENIKLKVNEKESLIDLKMPTDTSRIAMTYGIMPRESEGEVVISPSLASKLGSNIKDLISKELILSYENKQGKSEEIKLKISGIFNGGYDDFIVSQDIEKRIYKNYNINEEEPSSISFETKRFEDIPKVQGEMEGRGITLFTKYKEVEAFKSTFTNLIKLYTVVSYLILGVGLIISSVILYKIAIERFTEVGILSALGYTKSTIKQIMFKESMYFAAITILISLVLIKFINILYLSQFGYSLSLNIKHILVLIIIDLILSIALSVIINSKLIETDIAKALRG